MKSCMLQEMRAEVKAGPDRGLVAGADKRAAPSAANLSRFFSPYKCCNQISVYFHISLLGPEAIFPWVLREYFLENQNAFFFVMLKLSVYLLFSAYVMNKT